MGRLHHTDMIGRQRQPDQLAIHPIAVQGRIEMLQPTPEMGFCLGNGQQAPDQVERGGFVGRDIQLVTL